MNVHENNLRKQFLCLKANTEPGTATISGNVYEKNAVTPVKHKSGSDTIVKKLSNRYIFLDLSETSYAYVKTC